MVVPLTDQKRLSHILADDLQPRIDWAYALEQTIALLGGGYLTAGNGDPNGLVTKPEGFLFLDLTTPAVWQNQNGGTVWTNLSAGGGGSGLPDPWTANQTSGEVTATTDTGDKIALEFLAAEDTEEPPLVITSDTELGSTDLLLLRQSVDKGGADIFSIDDSGEANLHIVDPNASGLTVDDDTGVGDGPLLSLSAPMAAGGRLFLAEFHANDLPGGGQTVTQFDGGLRVQYDNGPISGAFFVFDPVANLTTLKAQPEQTEPLLVVKNEDGDEAIEGFPNGSINQYLSDPAVIGWLIKMAADQTASPLQIQDVDGHVIYDFDIANGAIVIRPLADPTEAFTSWYAQSFAGYSESDLLIGVNGTRIELDSYIDNNTPANNYTTVTLKTQPQQTREVILIHHNDLGQDVFRVLPSGAIGTSAGEPADADINPGECFRWFDPTNGASAVKFKGKSLNGTVVTSSGPMT